MEDTRHFDRFDNLIQLGDTVFFCEPTRQYARLAKGKVVRFTPKKVEIEYVSTLGGYEHAEKLLVPYNRVAVPIA